MKTERNVISALRFALGFVFLWAFLDKTFGLGFATERANAWLNGGSPTAGFLTHAAKGPLAGAFNSLAGIGVVDWLFMLGLLFVGLTLISGKLVRWGCYAGIAMLALMYLALLLPENNPVIDEHVIYILVLALIATRSGKGLAINQ